MTDCPHEPAVVHAVLAGTWPERCDETLVTHASTCPACREVSSVSLLLREDIDQARFEMHVPAAGQVWWRAAVRARLDSTHTAAQPITWMHGITGAIALGAALAALTTLWPMIPGLAEMLRSVIAAYLPSPEVAIALAGGVRAVVIISLAAAAILILAPIALYFVLSDD